MRQSQTPLNTLAFMLVLCTVMLLPSSSIFAEAPASPNSDASSPKVWENSTYIDANQILMFVNNNGGYARDLEDVFGYDYGTFYPYFGVDLIVDSTFTASPLYAAGLWIGGKVNGEVRVALAEYNSEYWPGPMIGGTFDPQGDVNPEYRVFKLYSDSLESNPNQDYLDWPEDQGAPVDEFGQPNMRGDQMLWSVFNDANPSVHTNNAGETDPLGVEVRQLVWASNGAQVKRGDPVFVNSEGTPNVAIAVEIVDSLSVIFTDYRLPVQVGPAIGCYWRLERLDGGHWITVIDTSTNFAGDADPVFVDGLKITVLNQRPVPPRFEVVANENGPLDPPAGGAFDFNNFPSDRPDSTQQVGDGLWGMHTADNGGSCNGGTRASYDAFLDRVTRSGSNSSAIGTFDYEMRFTGSYDNPGVNGSYVIEWFNDDNVFWVPFEIWRIGIGTPDDPGDDVRMIPFIFDYGSDNTYNLESWGCVTDPLRHGADGEHSASALDNDPWTDLVYWYEPVDDSPGEAGYLAAEAEMLAGTFPQNASNLISSEVFARMVLVNWNGHTSASGDTLTIPPVFTQDLPEQGSVFRITNVGGPGIGLFNWTIEDFTNPDPAAAFGISMEYQLFNRSSQTIDSMYLSFWWDPDLGTSGDDLVGCLSDDDLWFCYNADNFDFRYGTKPPAIGAKLVHGPLVASPGDTAVYARQSVPDHRNLGLSAFATYFNALDPNDYVETFNYMRGKQATGADYVDPITGLPDPFMHDGDPVTGMGDLDLLPADKRCMATCGPFTMSPGDSQYVLINLGVARGNDRLASLSKLFFTLTAEPPDPSCCVGSTGNVDDDPTDAVVLADLTILIDYLFISYTPVACPPEADLDLDGDIDLGDLTILLDHLFLSLAPLPSCP